MNRIRFHGFDLSAATNGAPRSPENITILASWHVLCPLFTVADGGKRMRYWRLTLLAPAIVIAAACGRDNSKVAADSALNADLTLANQLAPFGPIDSTEAGLAALSAAPTSRAATTSRSTARTTTTRRTSGPSGVRSSSGGTVTSSSGGEVVVKKNTKRDAIIGAAAGAAIGAATSKDRVKGAVIGGVVGGVLGGVIGNNVDVQKKRRPH
jgi:outer membrane lipoprotein SlyB